MANKIMNPTLDPTSPYYMPSSENPGAPLVSILLNGENYHSWARAMTTTLEYKNKLEFIDRSLPKPPLDDDTFILWKKYINLVISCINHSVEPSIMQSILCFETTQEIWADLHQRYHRGDMFRISELIGQIHNIKQGNQIVGVFYNQLKGLWQQLDDYRPIPSCHCDKKCDCTIPTMRNYRENEYVIYFLIGLNEQFTSVGSQIMLFDHLPPISRVFSTLVQQERQMQLEGLSFSGNLSTGNGDFRQRGRGRGIRGTSINKPGMQGKSGYAGRGREHRFCTYCQRTGQTADVCYKKHGYPPSFSTNNRSTNNYDGQTSSDMSLEQQDFADSTTKDDITDPILAFTPAQHNALKCLIQESMNQIQHSTNQITSASSITIDHQNAGHSLLEHDWCS